MLKTPAARWQVLELSWQLSAMLLASLAKLYAGKLLELAAAGAEAQPARVLPF